MATQTDRMELNEAALNMMINGVTQTDLEKIFGADRVTVKKALLQVTPCGTRLNTRTYRIKDVAPHIVKPAGDWESYIKGANHMDLPKALTKEFWAGQLAKQKFQTNAGELWPTEQVVSEVGNLFKMMKMSAQLMSDAVERSTELTERQRSIIRDLSDNMIEDLRRSIVENFTQKTRVKDEEDGEL